MYSGQPKKKLAFYHSRTFWYLFTNPEEMENLGRPGRYTRTRNLVSGARDSRYGLRLRYMRPTDRKPEIKYDCLGIPRKPQKRHHVDFPYIIEAFEDRGVAILME